MDCHPRCVGFAYCEVNRLRDEGIVSERERLEAACDEYLLGLHCTLWGEPFEVISPKGRALAVAWLAQQIEGVLVKVRCCDAPEFGLHREGCPNRVG